MFCLLVNKCHLFSNSYSNSKITLFIYSWEEGGKTNGFWLELFIGQVSAVSDHL